MKYTFIIFLCCITFTPFSQEGLSPLTANPDLFKSNQKMQVKALQNSFDSTFIYLTDTLILPFFDDFSRDKFQSYSSEPGDGNVTEELYHRMLKESDSLPFASPLVLTDSHTYRSAYDPVLDTTILYYFDSTRFLYDDLSNYAPNYVQTYAYPPYLVYDTLDGNNNPKDTIWLANPEYIQDSARAFITTINNPNALWLNKQAYHNYRFAIDPWSLGVVTFDGLDENGYPYNFNSSVNGVADTLLAKPLDLSGNAPGDSVYFSFLFQREGYGDQPEANSDSLFLDFYSPTTQEWKRVWRTNGGPTTDFKVAHIPVTNTDYFQEGFQFRFMNYGSRAGALDHFHIDYVHLRTLSGMQDTLFKDFALVYPISTLLKDYTSVPWKHYRNNPTNKMSDEVKVSVRNGSELTENNQNGEVNVYYDDNLEGSYVLNASTLSGGNINYAPRTNYTSLHDFSSGYSYDPNLSSDTSATFYYEGVASAQFPNRAVNDSTFGQQVFKNYYAYDDGTAEKAYGVTGIQGLLAYQFNAYQPDSLIAIKIHFVPSVVDVSNNLFLLTVWDDDNGEPGNVLYEDEFFYPQQPIYTYGRNQFKNYFFKDTMKVAVGETYYVGMRQIDEERLNIGFDMNHDNSDKIFWSIDGGSQWYNSSYQGSIMMRPVVTSKLDYTLGVPHQEIATINHDFTIYPNPAMNYINIKIEDMKQSTTFRLTDLNGRHIKEFSKTEHITISDLEKGIYLITCLKENKSVKTKKLVVR